jgi:glutathione S-transferase
MTIHLYELVTEAGRPLSPFVWRIKYALAHKGLDFDTRPVGFTDIPKLCGGQHKTVPIIEDGATTVCDSWAIADYLDATYKQNPIFSSPAERAMVKFFEGWFFDAAFRNLFAVNVLDIHNHLRPTDKAYFRQTREKQVGTTLEAFTANREARLPDLRKNLKPMRVALANQPFLGGDKPNYADYIALGAFLWTSALCTLPVLEKDDMLNGWLQRGFDLYGGIGRGAPYPLAA